MSTFTCPLMQRHANQIAGVLDCFDRILICGFLNDASHPAALAQFLSSRGVAYRDLAQWFSPLTRFIKDNAHDFAGAAGLEVEFISKGGVRKEDLVDKIISAQREKTGRPPQGLVAVLAVVEGDKGVVFRTDKQTHQTRLLFVTSRYEHFYFYYVDPDIGLFHLRVGTRAPFNVQVCMNGHSWLACKMDKARVAYARHDNAFTAIGDWAKAQQLASSLDVEMLRDKLSRYAERCCPVQHVFPQERFWSVWQLEASTDLVFKKPEDLIPLYDGLCREAICSIHIPQVCQFFDKHPHPDMDTESRFRTLREGRSIKHVLDRNSIKMYDKAGGAILRIETTSNDVTSFKIRRQVEHRHGEVEWKIADATKCLFSLPQLLPAMTACNRRYLQFLSGLDDHSGGVKRLAQATADRRDDKGSLIRGLDFFKQIDLNLILSIVDPAFVLRGFGRKDLMTRLAQFGKTPSWFTRQLRRLRELGLIAKVLGRRTCQLTALGRQVFPAALSSIFAQILPAISLDSPH